MDSLTISVAHDFIQIGWGLIILGVGIMAATIGFVALVRSSDRKFILTVISILLMAFIMIGSGSHLVEQAKGWIACPAKK